MIVLRNKTYIFLKYGVSLWNKPVVEGGHTKNLYRTTGSIQSFLKPKIYIYKKSNNKKLLLDYQDLFKYMALYVQCFKYAFVQDISPILKHRLDSSVDIS